MQTAKFVKEITVTDPDTKGNVQLSVFKHSNGGMFAIDSSWIEQCFDEGCDPVIYDPFRANIETPLDLKLLGL